jgi:pimeloyl-ACP methyl ester carboxylesterase
MRDAYRRMRDAEGDTPSPIFSTYARGQTPDAFDLLVIDGVTDPRGAIVFLHGSGGNFSLPCWLVARAAREARLVTYCPSTGTLGDWWSKAGEETVRRTIALVRRRGLQRIHLAGLSNGGIGASRLAPRLRGEIQGLVLVSGAAPEASGAGVPTLVVHGANDAMCPTWQARGYASRTGARFTSLPGGHFGLLTHEEDYRRAIADWLVASVGR